MTSGSPGPLTRPFPLHRVTPAGVETKVEANEAERAALAADLDLPAIHALDAQFRIVGSRDRIVVKGRVRARIDQLCGVTLEPFPTDVDEDVEVTFVVPDPRASRTPPDEVELSMEHDSPEELTGDAIDLGAITAEFLALGLDPFPRKPGIAFEPPTDVSGEDGPFAGLAALRPKAGEV